MSNAVFFNIEVVRVVANALLEAGVDHSFVSSAAKNEFLAANIASNRYLNSWFHSCLRQFNKLLLFSIDERLKV